MIAFVHPSGVIHVYHDDGNVAGSLRTLAGTTPSEDEVLALLKERGYEPVGGLEGSLVQVKVATK